MINDTNEPAVDSSLLPSHDRKKVKVVVVGQMPPPVNGQSMMIRSFMEGEYKSLELVYVPMRFSRSTAEIGLFNFRKVVLLVQTLFQIVAARLKSGASILYYPPAGANLVPVLRDMFLLVPTRFLFRHTVFHFHAAGLSNIYQRLPKLLRGLFHMAYDRPELAIFTTAATSAEAEFLHAKKTLIIPCGIADQAARITQARKSVEVPSILFAGILCAEKGVLILLEACRRLLKSAVPFRLTCIGAFQSAEFEKQVRGILEETGLDRVVEFPGVMTGLEKDDLFASADLFCFPSYYPAESFGLVLIEAMSFSLPIVATDWQGIPEVVGRLKEGIDPAGALLVPPRDAETLTSSLKRMLSSPEERIAMGHSNRIRYLKHFTVERYRTGLEDALVGLDEQQEDLSGVASAGIVIPTPTSQCLEEPQSVGVGRSSYLD